MPAGKWRHVERQRQRAHWSQVVFLTHLLLEPLESARLASL